MLHTWQCYICNTVIHYICNGFHYVLDTWQCYICNITTVLYMWFFAINLRFGGTEDNNFFNTHIYYYFYTMLLNLNGVQRITIFSTLIFTIIFTICFWIWMLYLKSHTHVIFWGISCKSWSLQMYGIVHILFVIVIWIFANTWQFNLFFLLDIKILCFHIFRTFCLVYSIRLHL